ncbi:ERAD-associated E3 ubiquitin-protein ligase component HRD3A-like [Cajanus cajan]|uniref:ERAD-associated E3 ubiquitin-protein ligase component HRD3A-like n=1 Tax=Cajanus cajan TaxID=3821 RepID=UPI00098D7A29|nr:ERAD-associated E3 ubiquitin-protein ligase component HRD3A-like [Cajanus cajan]
MSADPALIEDAAAEIAAAADIGHPAAQSVLGFLWGMGLLRERSKGKAFLYHHFASEGGNMQSKMALAYTYTRQDMFEKAVKLYTELAEVAVNSFLISKDSPVIEPVRLYNGAEENKEALRKSKGEEDEDFQILEYQAQKGNAAAMYKVGLLYYFGLRGLRRDHSKALSWFLKAVEKGEPRSMELLGEINARGAGVERNYTKAFEWGVGCGVWERERIGEVMETDRGLPLFSIENAHMKIADQKMDVHHPISKLKMSVMEWEDLGRFHFAKNG